MLFLFKMTVVENIVYASPLLVMQLISVVLYGLCTDYGQEAVGTTAGSQTSNTIDKYYPFFQDVHVMIFIGFGFLMTFLKRYSHSALGYTMYLSSLAIQYGILINGPSLMLKFIEMIRSQKVKSRINGPRENYERSPANLSNHSCKTNRSREKARFIFCSPPTGDCGIKIGKLSVFVKNRGNSMIYPPTVRN